MLQERYIIPGPLDYNPPLRSSRQDIRGTFQFFQDEYQNGSSGQEERSKPEPERELERPQFPLRRQLSSDTITLSHHHHHHHQQHQQHQQQHKGGGDTGFFLNERDDTDGDPTTKTSFADLNRIRSNGDHSGLFRFA